MNITNTILILSNHHSYTYNFRKEIIETFIEKKYKVIVVQPYGSKVENLKEMGCECIDLPLDRRGKNIINDIKLLIQYFYIIKKTNPDIVFSYTIKPNLYGGLVCRILKIPHIPNITGLGTAVEQSSILQKFILMLYKISFKKSDVIMFQNNNNLEFFNQYSIGSGKKRVIPGSGVNLSEFTPFPYPALENQSIKFVFISRIMKEKGIEEYLIAAKRVRKTYPNTEFHVCGACDDEYKEVLIKMHNEGTIIYHGLIDDVKKMLGSVHCVVHPSYYPEGISNILLEGASCERPLITTEKAGCREVVDHGVNGYIVKIQDGEDLIEKIELFISLSSEEKKNMGRMGRLKVEKEFNRNIVVSTYVEETMKII